MKAKHVPLRKCIVCQKMLSKKEMIRIVRNPEGVVELDVTGKKNGRGAYLCGKLDGFEKARKSRAFDRALKVSLASDDYDRLEREFVELNKKFASVECGDEPDESEP
jgi:uncharacterized protein